MSDKPPPIHHPPRLIPNEVSPKEESHQPAPAENRPPEAVLERPGDRYTPSLLNRVIQNLKSLIVFRADRSFELSAKKESPPLTAEEKELLSDFEKFLLAHFQDGVPVGQKLEPGRAAKYLAKTEGEWREFFQRLLPFTLEKKGNFSDLQALIYRGLLREGEKGPEIGTLISDLQFQGGKTDKFARLQIQGSPILEQLAGKVPGDLLAQALFAEWIGGPEFAYKAISHRVVNPEAMKTLQSAVAQGYQSPEEGRKATLREGRSYESQGIALSARTEQLISERLNLPRKSRQKTASLDRGVETGPVFVPWWQVFSRKNLAGRPRWWVPLLYFVVLSAAALGAFSIFKLLWGH